MDQKSSFYVSIRAWRHLAHQRRVQVSSFSYQDDSLRDNTLFTLTLLGMVYSQNISLIRGSLVCPYIPQDIELTNHSLPQIVVPYSCSNVLYSLIAPPHRILTSMCIPTSPSTISTITNGAYHPCYCPPRGKVSIWAWEIYSTTKLCFLHTNSPWWINTVVVRLSIVELLYLWHFCGYSSLFKYGGIPFASQKYLNLQHKPARSQ